MNVNIQISGKDLIELLKNKYPDAEIDFVSLNLYQSIDYAKSRAGRNGSDEVIIKILEEKKTVRIFRDGSFEDK